MHLTSSGDTSASSTASFSPSLLSLQFPHPSLGPGFSLFAASSKPDVKIAETGGKKWRKEKKKKKERKEKGKMREWRWREEALIIHLSLVVSSCRGSAVCAAVDARAPHSSSSPPSLLARSFSLTRRHDEEGGFPKTRAP